MRNQRRRFAKRLRLCGGVRLSNIRKEMVKTMDDRLHYGAINVTIGEYKHAVALGKVPGHRCWRG